MSHLDDKLQISSLELTWYINHYVLCASPKTMQIAPKCPKCLKFPLNLQHSKLQFWEIYNAFFLIINILFKTSLLLLLLLCKVIFPLDLPKEALWHIGDDIGYHPGNHCNEPLVYENKYQAASENYPILLFVMVGGHTLMVSRVSIKYDKNTVDKGVKIGLLHNMILNRKMLLLLIVLLVWYGRIA